MKKFQCISITLIVAVLLIKYYFNVKIPKENETEESHIHVINKSKLIYKQFVYFNYSNKTVNLVIFDLTTKLEPVKLYADIKCRKSALYVVRTTLCVHDLREDAHVSAQVWNKGVWEGRILR